MSIVSRKAVDLEVIDSLPEFKKYLDELKNKYSPGTEILASRTGVNKKIFEGVGKNEKLVLEGQMYLELPSTNKDFLRNNPKYKELANSSEYNIKIRLENE